MRRPSTRLRALLAAALLAAVVGLAGCGGKASGSTSRCAGGLNDHTDTHFCGLGLTPPQPRPQFTLTDTAGKAFSFGRETSGKPTVLFFGYTTCPDVCPTTMADIAEALRQVSASARVATQVIFVSTDPTNDTPAAITSWLSKFDPDLPTKFIGLRGSTPLVHAAEVAAHVNLDSDGGQTHSAEVLIYGADDYARVAELQSDNEAGDMAHDLDTIVEAK